MSGRLLIARERLCASGIENEKVKKIEARMKN